MRKEITKEVEVISKNLQETCLKKLSGDAKLALEKVSSLSSKLDETQKQFLESEKEISLLKEDLMNKKVRLDVSESLLLELLKQMQRRINARKSVGVQVQILSRRHGHSSLVDGDKLVLPP